MLERHKGCDILDINPGAGLWSQKIHKFLQPRSHVLLEPGYQYFKKFLGPLLAAPDSKYSLVEDDPCEIKSFRTLADEGAFPHQIRRERKDAKAQEINNTLLVIGSLAWDPKLPGLNFDSMSKQLFHHFTSAAPANDLFHAFGLVRSLLWVQHDDFSPMVARSIAGMQKGNRFTEMLTNVNVLVQAAHSNRKVGRASHAREPQFEIESTTMAMQTARKNNMELPSHRRENIHDFAEELEKESKKGVHRSSFIQQYLHSKELAGQSTIGLPQEAFLEHFEHEKRLREEYPDLKWEETTFTPQGKSPRWNLKDHPAKAEVSRLYRKRAGVANILRIKEAVEATADIGEELYKVEYKILKAEDEAKKEALMKKMEKLEKDWEYGYENTALNYGSALLTETDDRIALRSPPHPRLQWDRRQFEPLTMLPSEVWPHNRLSLLLCEPIPRDHSQDLDWLEWVQDFIFGLYPQPHVSVPEGLDMMQHGLSNIMKDCPSLTDPQKGGRLQMHHLRVRMLTGQMIEELVTAYRKWPFKTPGSDHNKFFRIKGSIRGAIPRKQ